MSNFDDYYRSKKMNRYSYKTHPQMDGVKGYMVGDISNGEYVKYSDVQELEAENKKLRDALEKYTRLPFPINVIAVETLKDTK